MSNSDAPTGERELKVSYTDKEYNFEVCGFGFEIEGERLVPARGETVIMENNQEEINIGKSIKVGSETIKNKEAYRKTRAEAKRQTEERIKQANENINKEATDERDEK